MRILQITLLMILLTLTIVVSAQSDECPVMVQEAVAATGNICADVGRNQACYGNISIDTQLSNDSLVFDKEGDMVDLTSVESMTLSPLDEGTGAWGVALLSVQANIPDTVPGQNVSFLIFGDVELTNAGSAMEAFYFKGGIGNAGCSEAANGILIQTPQGAGEIELVANDVKITLGSSAFFTAQPEDEMTVALLEGTGSVEAEGVTQSLEVGMQVAIPMDANLSAAGAPSEPEPIPDNVAALLASLYKTPPGALTFDARSTTAPGEITTVDLTFEIPETDCPALDTQDQIDVGLVIDVSGSMQGTRLAVAKSAALRFLNQLNPDTTQVGLVRFANRATALNNLSSDYVPIDDNINNLTAGGGTNIASGLQQAANILNSNARPGSRRIIQLLSDGESNIGNEIATARQIRSQGIEIFAVGFGGASATTLRQVASEGNFFIFSETNQGLNAAFNQTGQGIASGNRVAASNITINLMVDTDNFEIQSDLTLDGSVEDGIVTWEVPIIYDGQSIQRSLVVVPLNEGTFSLGNIEITYDTCLDGDSVSLNTLEAPDFEVGAALTDAEQIDSGVLNTTSETSNELDVLGTDRWLLDLSDANIISVVVTGAGSELVPDVLVNEETVISPLYSVRDVEAAQRSSIYHVGDINAAWLYVQSNSRADVGVYVLDVNDTVSGESTTLPLDADGIIETQTEFEGRLYDIQGNVSEGDFVTVMYEFGNFPQIDIVSLTDGLTAESQTAWRVDRNTIAYIFQLQGEAPYRMVVSTDTQYRIGVQSGDQLQTHRGEFTVNQPANSPGSDLEVDRWTIELEADQPYIISVPGAGGRGIYVELSRVADNSATYVSDNFWNRGYHDEIGPFVLEEPGTYSLIVAAGRDYQIVVNETSLPQTEPQAIVPGQSVSGETIVGTKGLQWTFEGKANQFATIVLDPSRSDVSWVEMSLATMDGVDIDFSDDDGALVTIGPVLLTEDLTYVITVAPRSSINAMFDLSLSLVDVGNANDIITGRGANLRSGPGTNFGVVGGVEANETLFAIGAVEAGDWIYVVTYDGKDGWLFAQTLGDLSVVEQLAVVDSAGNVIREASTSSDMTTDDDDASTDEESQSDETSSTESSETSFSCSVAPGQTANLRSGPGTNFDRAGTLAANQSSIVVKQAAGSDGFTWWQLDTGNWIREDVVFETGNCEDAPQS